MAPVEQGDLGTRPRRSQLGFLAAILCLLTVVFTLLLWRLYQIQIVGHEGYAAAARRIRQSTDRTIAYRGDVRTSDQVILARDFLAYEVGVDLDKVAPERLPSVLRVTCDALEYSDEKRWHYARKLRQLKQKGRRYLRLGSGVEPALLDEIRAALEKILPDDERAALVATRGTRRVYPQGSFLASVVGVTDIDGRGLQGVEREYDAYLAGRGGRRQLIKDALQRSQLYSPDSAEVPAVHGYNVYLTIDSRIQGIVEEELEKGITDNKAEAGLAIVMDCRNGAVLALANWPTFDPNHFAAYPEKERDRRRCNRVVENLVEPGSVMKPFVASKVLESGLVRRDETIWSGGRSMRLPHRTVRDVRDHGPLTMEEAVVHSSNIGMSILGLKLGIDGLIETLNGFRFCEPTGIDLPAEAVYECKPRRDWSEEFTAVSVSFGYETQLSPIQLCTGFAALINGGYLLRPRVVERLSRDGDELWNVPETLGRPIREETSRAVREILLRVVEEGTGRYLRLDGLRFGGKTGTADMGEKDPAGDGRRGPRYTKTNYLASFEAFAPYENPEIVILVMIEKPRGARYYGSWVAGPVVGRVLCRLYDASPKPESLAMRE